jgi:ABC-type transport system involved in multi-copper enzyme maturation permease subunit
MGSQYGIPDLDLKLLGYNAFFVVAGGAASVGLVSSIFSSLFISNEFSAGVVRTVILRGINRFYFYFSKLIVVISVPIIYTILSCGAAFAAGCYLWGMGEPEKNTILGIAKSLGMFLMVETALHSLYVMVAFLVRSTGAAVASNLALVIPIISGMLIWLINFILLKWFNIQHDVGEYWIGNHSGIFQSMHFTRDFVIKISVISASYLVLTSLIGGLSFWKRDIK